MTSAYRLLRAAQGNPLKDTRRKRKDYHKPDREKPYIKPLSKWERRTIVAWDGEGYTDPNGDHIYNLLGNSLGKYIRNDEGLSTLECFKFFFEYGDPKAINVVYGGSYDANMILRDLPQDHIKRLWEDGSVRWGAYIISYQNRKKLSVSRKRLNSNGRYVRETFTLWDVLGFYQSSFVKACRKWLGNLPILDSIEAMKQQRGTFKTDEIEDIIRYNMAECRLLVNLIEALFEALDEVDIQLKRYDGAGAIAAALMNKYEVHKYRGYDEIPEEIKRLAQFAYSGGRIEAPKLGNYEGKVYRKDINSAYPSASLGLPSYVGCRWTEEEWNGSDHSLVEVEWHIRKKEPFYPLFFRAYDGSISYPRQGHGVYWGYEAALLRDYFREGTDYTFLRAWNCEIVDETKPFAFINHLFAYRRQLKEAGSMANEAIKLGMNSTYGKVAQQVGYRNGRLPTYHQLLWAGQITSATRANLFRAAWPVRRSVIAFATDAVISTRNVKVDEGPGLGQWTPEVFHGITIVQAGVYWLKTAIGSLQITRKGAWNGTPEGCGWSAKYRGFDNGSLQRDKILDCWRTGESYVATMERFFGMGSALGTKDFKKWRHWIKSDRTLDIRPTGKRKAGAETCFADKLCATLAIDNMDPEMMSTPFPLIWVEGFTELRPTIDGIDIRLVEGEMEDSYA